MKSSLEIKTSFVSPVTLKIFIDKGYLPIFILRSIANSEVIGKYSNTAIHFRELSPSSELFHKKRDKIIDFNTFDIEYRKEMSLINFNDIIKRLESLSLASGSRGVVLLGFGSDNSVCHRSILSNILNESGLLENRVTELII